MATKNPRKPRVVAEPTAPAEAAPEPSAPEVEAAPAPVVPTDDAPAPAEGPTEAPAAPTFEDYLEAGHPMAKVLEKHGAWETHTLTNRNGRRELQVLRFCECDGCTVLLEALGLERPTGYA